MVLVAMPPLVTLLLHHEREKGSPLTEDEVTGIRDAPVCMTLPCSVAAEMADARGYDDVRLENAWEDWSMLRPTLGL